MPARNKIIVSNVTVSSLSGISGNRFRRKGVSPMKNNGFPVCVSGLSTEWPETNKPLIWLKFPAFPYTTYMGKRRKRLPI